MGCSVDPATEVILAGYHFPSPVYRAEQSSPLFHSRLGLSEAEGAGAGVREVEGVGAEEGGGAAEGGAIDCLIKSIRDSSSSLRVKNSVLEGSLAKPSLS